MGNQQKRNIDSLRKITLAGIFMMLMFIGVHPQAWAQKTSAEILVELNTEIDHHQKRIDKFDKKEDLKVLLTGRSELQKPPKPIFFYRIRFS